VNAVEMVGQCMLHQLEWSYMERQQMMIRDRLLSFRDGRPRDFELPDQRGQIYIAENQ